MKLKYTFAVSDVAGQTVAIPIDSGYGEQSIIKTNDTGAYILNLLKQDITIDDIISQIKKDFETESEEALETTVNKFIDSLKAADLLI
jgi:hypothetical protein